MANASQNIIFSALISAFIPFAQASSLSPTPAVSPTPTVIQQQAVTALPTQADSLIWVVKPGDTARSIAASFYGNESYWTTIWNDNTWIADPNSLPENSVISLRKDAQSSPEELNPTLAQKMAGPRFLSDGDRYVYLMTHTVSYGGLVWSMPLLNYRYISQSFSSYHPGIDMPTNYQTPIYAAADGTIVEAGWSPLGYGNSIVISHANGFYTRYAHMSFLKVNVGQYVTRGAEIGAAGCTGHCTGTHLHFEVHEAGHPINPLTVIRLW